jgi:hypothetical protein
MSTPSGESLEVKNTNTENSGGRPHLFLVQLPIPESVRCYTDVTLIKMTHLTKREREIEEP